MLHSPFAYECRAFARLIDIGENGTWAVKCHGWMRLSDEQFTALKPAATRHQMENCERWAIVKDYVPNPLRNEDISEVRRKLIIPQRARILPTDFHHRNFRESFVVDLGSTKTYPCSPFWSDGAFRNFYKRGNENFKSWQRELEREKEIEEARVKRQNKHARTGSKLVPVFQIGVSGAQRKEEPQLGVPNAI